MTKQTDPMTTIQDAVTKALATQSWFTRRKDTLAAVAATVLQVANLAVLAQGDMPTWGAAAIAVVVAIAQIVVHAATPGAITPSMGYRLAAAHATTPTPVQQAATPTDTGLPVYEMGSSQ